MDERGEEVRKHVFDTARVDLVARDAAEDGCVVESAPGGRRGRLGTVGVHGRTRQLKAAGSVGQDREDRGVVGEKRVHEAVGGSEKAEAEQAKGCVLHVVHVVGRGYRDSTAYFAEKNRMLLFYGVHPLQENAEFYEVVVIPADQTRDVTLLHARVRELEDGLATVCFNTHGLGLCGGLGICRVYVERESPVLAHGGVVDVHDEVLRCIGPDWQPVRAPLPPVVLELLDLTDQPHVSAYDLPAEVPERDVEAALLLLDTVAGIPQSPGFLDGVLDRLCLAHLYDDEQLFELGVRTHGHVSD